MLVRPKPAVAILVTGDELIKSGRSGSGRVRDALGPMLPALIDNLGGEVTALRHVSDHADDELSTAVEAAVRDMSVVVVAGSTSVGTTDRLHCFLDEGGARWVVDTVACRPGHPNNTRMPSAVLVSTVSARPERADEFCVAVRADVDARSDGIDPTSRLVAQGFAKEVSARPHRGETDRSDTVRLKRHRR